MSKIAKGIKNVVKKVFKSVTKVFKKIVQSPIFKVALVAATVYFGGAALGFWGSAATGTGTAVAGAAAGSDLASASELGTFADSLGSAGAAAGAGAGDLASTADLLSAAGASSAGGAITAPTASSAFAPLAGKAGGLVGSVLSGAGKVAGAASNFVKANPLLAAVGLNAIAGANSPDQIDLAREQARLVERNQDVGGITIPISPNAPQSPQPAQIAPAQVTPVAQQTATQVLVPSVSAPQVQTPQAPLSIAPDVAFVPGVGLVSNAMRRTA